MKLTLEVKLVFVWTLKRIRGHFVIYFLAFLLTRHLEYRLAKNHTQASIEKIQETINSLSFAKVTLDGWSFLIKTKASDLAQKIFRNTYDRFP